MSCLKWLKFSTYEFDKKHDCSLVKSDAKVIAMANIVLAAVMILMLVYVLVCPEIRYDSDMDNLPKLIAGAIAGVIGFVLAMIPIKNHNVLVAERKLVRLYFSVTFLGLCGYEFINSSSKLDPIFVYLIYCMIVVMMLHINPIIYAIQTIAVLVVTVPVLYDSFGSIGTITSYVVFMLSLVYLVFRSNITDHKKFIDHDEAQDHKYKLEQALREKTEEVLSSIEKQTAIQENVILAIADLVESRDTDTGTHIKATSYYAKLIAENARKLDMYNDVITDEFIYLIEKAAPMHDLGKIMIPDAILKAPRRLTTDEFNIMKQHTTEGARIIEHVYTGIETPEYIKCASNIAHYHHERWAGNGYPCGLSGEDIPLEARIMAIADVFDALVSKRCYKDAYPLTDAFAEIQRNAGVQFDPCLVSAFLASKSEIEGMIVNDFGK